MSFAMEKDGHEIEMSQDRVYGLEIDGITCPYKERLEVIEKHTYDTPTYGLNFIDTYEKLAIANADWHLKLLRILSSEFTTKDDTNEE